MIAALLLAAAVAGQVNDETVAKKASPDRPAIDWKFVPTAGDRVLLGLRDSKSDSCKIDTVVGFSTQDGINLFLDSSDARYERGMNTMPDSYILRAGTMAVLKDRFTRDSIMEGKPLKTFVAKVEILDGEFNGKTFFVVWYACFRFVGETPRAPQAKMAPHKRSGRRPAPAAAPIGDAKLVLMDLTMNPWISSTYVKVDGRVRCTSDVPLKSVQATVSFEDRDGKLIRSVFNYCDPSELAPGDIASISVLAENDPRVARVKISFKDNRDKALPWVDQSGTNAHQ
jgi:hypothetical protein